LRMLQDCLMGSCVLSRVQIRQLTFLYLDCFEKATNA
jgi:hypothetical protein